jgi:hypothetical protein
LFWDLLNSHVSMYQLDGEGRNETSAFEGIDRGGTDENE